MIDLEQVHLWWRLFHYNDSPVEVRMIKSDKLNASGYYKNLNNVIRDIELYDQRDGWQIYFVLNEIDDACYNRQQCEHVIERPTATTIDDNITARRWVFIDLDPKRPKEVSSSNEQLDTARKKANQIYKFLKQQGFENMVAACSGNGWHLQIPCSLSNTPENKELVSRFLESLQMLFEDELIEIDQKPKNASRLCKLYGTTAKKGMSTAERPHRLSKIVRYPEEVIPNKREYFEKVANLYQKEVPQPSKENNWGREKFDVENFLNKHGLKYKKKEVAEGTRYILDECPFHNEHKSPDSMVFQHRNGAISFFCFHNSCNSFTWRDLRLMYEPDAYDKKDYREYQHKRNYYDKYAPIPTEIKAENADDGKKWLSLDEIETIRDEDLVAIPSGIYQLDKRIKGFILGEVTLLSGINASGKSSLLNTFVLSAVNKGFKSAIWSGEMPANRLKGWICQTAAGKSNVEKVAGSEYAYETKQKYIPPIVSWLKDKLFIYNNNYGSNSQQLLSDINEIVEQKKVQFVILDNLMSMSLDEIAGDKNEKQKQLILALSDLAKKKNIHVLIVAHPRKEANFTLLRKESISGTSDLTNVVQNLLLIHRVGKDFQKRATEFWGSEKVNELMEFSNVVEIAKNRTYGFVDITIGLYYEEQTRRFKNSISEYVHYGWEPDNGFETYTLPTPKPTAIPPNTNFDNQTNTIPIEDENYWAQYKHDETTPF